jgi:vancomycin aglycone glucosyltransferase
MKIAISSIGSRGDVQPILALARELRSLGHGAVLCVAPNFKRWVESFGVECVPLGLDVEQLTRERSETKRKPSGAEMRKRVPDSVRESFKVLGDAARGCDLIVAGGGLQTAGRSIAESLKLPYVYATYCPATLPSPRHPPPMVHSQSLPKFVNRLLWRTTGPLWNRVFRDVLNEERAKLGLSAVTDVQRHVLTEQPWVAADAVLAPADSSGGMQITQTGAWFLDDPTELPDELERFLDDGEPPIYFGFGSMAASNETVAIVIEAARTLGRRAIVSQGWAKLSAIDANSDCISIGDINHERLFPRVAAIVHHGGAGTTTAAARAGKPQVVVPFLYDQYYWSHRVRQLRIGAAGPTAKKLTADALARGLRECLKAETVASAWAIAGRIQLQGARSAAERLVALAGVGL